MLGALVTGEAWLWRFSTLRENNVRPHQVSDKRSTTTDLNTKIPKINFFIVIKLPVCGLVTHPLFGGGETGDSEGQALLRGGSSSSSSSEELSSVRSITSTFLPLS